MKSTKRNVGPISAYFHVRLDCPLENISKRFSVIARSVQPNIWCSLFVVCNIFHHRWRYIHQLSQTGVAGDSYRAVLRGAEDWEVGEGDPVRKPFPVCLYNLNRKES